MKRSKIAKRKISEAALETVAGGLDTPIMPKGVTLRELSNGPTGQIEAGYQPQSISIRGAIGKISAGLGTIKNAFSKIGG